MLELVIRDQSFAITDMKPRASNEALVVERNDPGVLLISDSSSRVLHLKFETQVQLDKVCSHGHSHPIVHSSRYSRYSARLYVHRELTTSLFVGKPNSPVPLSPCGTNRQAVTGKSTRP